MHQRYVSGIHWRGRSDDVITAVETGQSQIWIQGVIDFSWRKHEWLVLCLIFKCIYPNYWLSTHEVSLVRLWRRLNVSKTSWLNEFYFTSFILLIFTSITQLNNQSHHQKILAIPHIRDSNSLPWPNACFHTSKQITWLDDDEDVEFTLQKSSTVFCDYVVDSKMAHFSKCAHFNRQTDKLSSENKLT